MAGTAGAISFRILTVELLDCPPPSKQEPDTDCCTVRLVGKTADNLDVCVWAYGFHPYFYLQLPLDWQNWQLDELREYIRKIGGKQDNLVDVTLQRSHATYCFTDGALFPFAKVSFRGVKSMNRCKNKFHNQHIALSDEDAAKEYKVCEVTSVPPLLKALHDTDIQPSGWATVSNYQCVDRESRTDWNIHTHISELRPLASDDIPQFIEASIDGEMVSASYEFPRADRPFDSVVQLAVHFSRRGETVPFRKVLFCVDKMPPTIGEDIEVRCHELERDMLMDFHAVLIHVNPDIITGYNINNFDIPYLLKRGKYLGLPASYFVLGRFVKEPTELKVAFRGGGKKDKGGGSGEKEKKIKYDVPIIPGRRVEDCLVTIKKFLKKKENSYALDHVANVYLGVGKHPVGHEDIFKAYQDTTDRLMAAQQINEVEDFLTEVRIISLIDFTASQPASDCLSILLQKWPPEYQEPIMKAFTRWLELLGSSLDVQVDQVLLQRYLTLRQNGDALLCSRGHVIDLTVSWAKDEDEMSNSEKKRARSPQSPSNDARELEVAAVFTRWEKRLMAESVVLQRVIDYSTTRKFAERTYGDDTSSETFALALTDHQQYQLDQKAIIGRYCMMDAELVWRIRLKQQHLISLMEMAKVSRVPCNMLMEKGETIKVINLFLLWCRANNYVATLRILPKVPFKGGQVLTPEREFYNTYVATLDFSSLYPSLIQSHGFCFLSLIHPNDVHLYLNRPDLVIEAHNIGPPSNQVYYWVRNGRTALPEILAGLVGQRSEVKAQLAVETDPNRIVILDQRQNAIKLVANSTYGFTGFEFSPWPCLPIAVCTTVKGRDAIMTTKKMVEDKYGCRVVYGDTDSVMIIFPGLDEMPKDQRLPYVFKMAKEAAAFVSGAFTKPMRLLFEKVYYPYLLADKKRYAGLKYMELDKPPMLDIKGFEAIRRDNCPILRDPFKRILDILLRELDPGKAVNYARRTFERLAKQNVPIEELIISKTLNEQYVNDSHIHVQVAKHLEQHFPLLAPSPGDRVPYVVVKLPQENRSTKNYMKGVSPSLVSTQGKEIDWSYYCYNQLKKPLDRIFCLVYKQPYNKKSNKQLTDYLWDPWLAKIDQNDAVQRGRVNGNQNLLTFFPKRVRVDDGNIDDDAVAADAAKEEEVDTVPKSPAVLPTTVPHFGDVRTMLRLQKSVP